MPLYKKDWKLKCSNYSPISLLSNIYKVLERLMYNGLYTFLEMNIVIYDLQFDFRQKCSTSHVLIHLTDKIREQLDSGNLACGIFVDLQKAFDTVEHSHKLVGVLWHFNPLALVASYMAHDKVTQNINTGNCRGKIEL